MRFLLILTTLTLPALAHAQGGVLLPSAPPGPTFVTLDQIAPRMVIGSTGIHTSTISILYPGSYVLAGDVEVSTGSAISIACDNVTLDLCGYTLSSTATTATGSGVAVANGRTNIVIRNGRIRSGVTLSGGVFSAGPGFQNGISGQNLTNALVEDVTVVGVAGTGISLLSSAGSSAAVSHCMVDTCGSAGIVSGQIRDCSATHCPSGLVAGQVVDSFADSLDGEAITGDTVTGCYAFSETSYAVDAGIAEACFAESRTQIGLIVQLASACYGKTYSGATALQVNGTASFCFGYHPNLPAITGRHALGCSAIGTITTTYKDHSE